MASQQSRALAALRQLIVAGDLPPGERLVEAALAERIQVSRTPVRYALGILENEGLLARSGNGSYEVKAFTTKQLDDAIMVRGVLEGLAARLVAEHGASRELVRELRECLAVSSELLTHPTLETADLTDYAEMNARFHRRIVEAADNDALVRLLAINSATAFGGADAIFFDKAPAPNRFRRLHYAHSQHESIVDALEAGEGARAEALMREHALVGTLTRRLPRRIGAAQAVRETLPGD
jgi:GntR family transcriptional regulator of vanillate catabolism